MAKKSSAAPTPQQAKLERKRERVLSKLYRERAYVDDNQQVRNLRHRQLEKEYNDTERQLHVLRGNPEHTYQDRRDVRHEFRFSSQEAVTRRGKVRRETAEGPVYHPDTVINWRNSKVGRRIDKELRDRTRNEYKAGPGDDVGHRIPLSAGVDPAAKGNVGLQNFQQNQSQGTWYDYEERQRDWLRQNPGQHLQVRVEDTYHESRDGMTRPIARTATEHDPKGRVVQNAADVYLNTKFQERTKVAKPDPKVKQLHPPQRHLKSM